MNLRSSTATNSTGASLRRPTAVATIALAGGTFVLAVTALEDAGAARELAGATQRLAELTREDMRLRDRPTIMITTYEITSPDPKVRFSVENIGLGPATYITVNVSGFDSTDDAVMTTGPVTIPRTILPNDSHSIVLPFAVRGNVADLTKTELIMVAIDRRGNPSYSLWRERDGAITLAASDFDTNWEPGHSLLERLAQL